MAERNVQKCEDLMRTRKAALDNNLGFRVPSNNPIIPWLIENVAQIMDTYPIIETGKTPCEFMHGRRRLSPEMC